MSLPHEERGLVASSPKKVGSFFNGLNSGAKKSPTTKQQQRGGVNGRPGTMADSDDSGSDDGSGGGDSTSKMDMISAWSGVHGCMNWFFLILQGLFALGATAVGAMAAAEFFTSNNDHYFSLNTWWIVALVLLVIGGASSLLTVFLTCASYSRPGTRCSRLPRPMQNWKPIFIATAAYALGFAWIAWLNNQDTITDIGYTRKFLQAMMFIVVGVIFNICIIVLHHIKIETSQVPLSSITMKQVDTVATMASTETAEAT